jgi:hypothetical protein
MKLAVAFRKLLDDLVNIRRHVTIRLTPLNLLTNLQFVRWHRNGSRRKRGQCDPIHACPPSLSGGARTYMLSLFRQEVRVEKKESCRGTYFNLRLTNLITPNAWCVDALGNKEKPRRDTQPGLPSMPRRGAGGLYGAALQLKIWGFADKSQATGAMIRTERRSD